MEALAVEGGEDGAASQFMLVIYFLCGVHVVG